MTTADVHRRLDGRLAGALCAIPAIRAVEIGAGTRVDLPGDRFHDAIRWSKDHLPPPWMTTTGLPCFWRATRSSIVVSCCPSVLPPIFTTMIFDLSISISAGLCRIIAIYSNILLRKVASPGGGFAIADIQANPDCDLICF